MESAQYMANVVTSANLLFGAMSIFLSLVGKYVPAAWVVLFAIVFDIADGKIARMGNETSQFGKQFDSLADLVSFVVAPAVLISVLDRPDFSLWRLLACLTVVFCGTFRLARFNTEAEDKISLFFNGLPTPGFAAIIVSFILVYHHYNLKVDPQVISGTVAILAMMMVSSIKYPTFKNIPLFQRRHLLYVALAIVALFIVPEVVIFILSVLYVLVMPIKANLMKGAKK